MLLGHKFIRSNGVLKALVKKYLTSGQDKLEMYKRISQEDILKIKDYFQSETTNHVLQLECCFNIMFYFQLRGQETLKSLKKDSIGFNIDGEREYAFLKSDLLQKNVKPSLRLAEFSDYKNARMYEQKGNPMCPVKRLKNYLNLLPETIKVRLKSKI